LDSQKEQAVGTLDGQVAFVTGAGRGIGQAAALALAEAGAAVALVARTEGQVAETAAALERRGERALPLVADVRDMAAVRHAVEEAEGQLRPITFLMNKAGTPGTQPRPTMTATSVAKTALIRLAEGLALSGAPHGVRAFAIHPGVVDTDLLRAYHLDLGRLTLDPPERAATLCVRLASGDYDSLSGRFLRVDDDLDELKRRAAEITERQLLTLRIKA
jgi:NAD(P)-dependent dehydrogenase (short-subunit alcohol dehydrogenase family)